MTIQEAERFYKGFGGRSFYMSREESGLSQEFDELEIPIETLILWKHDMVRDLIGKLKTQPPEMIPTIFTRVVDIMDHSDFDAKMAEKDKEKYAEELLDIMNDRDITDFETRKWIMEEMINGVVNGWSGGYYRFFRQFSRRNRKLNNKLHKFTEKMIQPDRNAEKVDIDKITASSMENIGNENDALKQLSERLEKLKRTP